MDKKRYKILEQIGQGGMGSVYRAFDTRMHREVAIKRIRRGSDAPESDAAAEQIVKEAGALASLQHPHIVTVYDVGTDKDGPYVVMEFIDGKTVEELIERAPLTWLDFRELAMQTQEALIGAQDRKLIHRDLKPSNLMLTWLPSGKFQVKIVDFGLAKLAEATTLGKLEDAEAVFGSIFFMGPEQFERAELDARLDMYSIGCVYYHALTQAYPFTGSTGMEVMMAHLNHEVIPLHEVRPDLPRWACDWVMWHLNRQPDDRPQNARTALKVFVQNDIASPVAPHPISAVAIPEQPHRPRLVAPGAMLHAPPPAQLSDPPRTQTAPQPLLPPEGSLPSVHSSPEPTPRAPTPPPPPPTAALTAVPTSRLAIAGSPPAVRRPTLAPAPPHAPVRRATKKKPELNTSVTIAIAVLLGFLVLLLILAAGH